jgi:FAD:protein FMN transferase
MTGSLTTQDPADESWALNRFWHHVDLVDAAANRFRHDAEITMVNARPGATTAVSPTLWGLLRGADVARTLTQGLCTPTVLPALVALGYDVDYDVLRKRGAQPHEPAVISEDAFTLDEVNQSVTLSSHCQLDLGSSAKALTVDWIADDVAARGGCVIEIGGDVAVRGQGPEGPWVIGIADELTVTGHEPRVSFTNGGLATSAVTHRRWRQGDQLVHHIIDPRTGQSAESCYAQASVSADSCLAANAFATAALLWGEEAGYYIAQAGWSARLVRHDGTIDYVGGWPVEKEAA